MSRSNRSFFLALMPLALILTGFGIKLATARSCSYTNTRGYCVMNDIPLLTLEEEKSFVFPEEKLISLHAPTILFSSTTLFGRLPSVVTNLKIHDGSVSELYVKNTLYLLSARRNQVRDVIIDGTETYLLKELDITYNELRSVPTNITKLTQLVKLYLYDNEIETVNMDHFKDLHRLQVLSLHNNRIIYIGTTVQLTLPNLANIGLGGNYLENLSVKMWSFPNLNRIYLNINRLRSIENFPEQFQSLKEAHLGYNRWSCAWIQKQIKPFFGTNKISIYNDGEKACSGKDVGKLCCYDSLDDVKSSIQLSTGDQIKQMSVKLEKMMDQIDKKISQELNSDLKTLTDRINDEIKSMESRINTRVNANWQQWEKQVADLKSDADTKRKEIDREVKSMESRINAKVNSIQDMIGDTQKQLRQEIRDSKSNMDKSAQQINIEVKSVESRIKAKVNANQASTENIQKQLTQEIGDLKSNMERTVQQINVEVKSVESNARKQVLDEFQRVKATLDENRVLIDDGRTQLGNIHSSIKDELKQVKEKLSENRALINDVIEDLYLEELEKQE